MMRGAVPAWVWWGAVAIVLMAAALRFSGLPAELPFVYHPDEPANIGVVHAMLRNATANPNAYNYPSLFYYLHVPGQWIVQILEGGLQPVSWQASGTALAPQPAVFIVGRALTALFGVGAVIVTMALAREVVATGPLVLFAGALAAFNPLLLAHSRMISPDVPSAFFVTLALVGAVRVAKGDRGYVLGGIMTGLAASTKYNAALVGLAVAAGHIMQGRAGFSRFSWLVLAGLLSIATFLLTSPFMILDFADASRGILAEVRHYATGHPGFEGAALRFNSIWLWQAFGVSLMLVALSAFHPERTRLVPIAAFVALYFVLLSVQVVRFDRNLMPIIPALVVLAACGFDVLRGALERHVTRPSVAAAVALVLAGALLLPGVTQSLSDTAARFTDKRAGVREWITQNVAPGTSIMMDGYGPYLDSSTYAITAPASYVLRQPLATIASFGVVVVTREGSGRFLRDPGSPEAATLGEIGKLACARKEFQGRDGGPEFIVFQMKC